MGKYYYIPTSTLNFNNILSSESLSPKAFYEKRGFGYSRWAIIPENDVDNAIILYENKFSFSRSKSDLEDHPILIEIYTDENFQNIGDGIYFSDHTIYLNPWNTRFVFFSEQDKKITLSMSESSLQTKLIPLYRNKFVVEQIDNHQNHIGDDINVNLNSNGIEKDKRIDKLKGLLYGYYIGAYLSSSKEVVIQLNMLKEVYNIFAAILASFEKKPAQFQLEKLEQIFQTLQTKSQFYKDLSAIISDESKVARLITFLRPYLRYNEEYDELALKQLLYSLETNDSQSETKNRAIAWIESKIEIQNKTIEKEHKFLQTDNSEIVVMDNKLSVVNSIKDNTECELFKAWINDVLSSEKYDGYVSTFKEELSDEITIKAKEIIGEEKWSESFAKMYLNKLRKHVRGEEFDVEWSNGIFSSIAAVLINGDDWDKLLSFMQLHEMYDYRLAFAMFGTLNGFAYLNRDFTDIIIDCDNRDYKANFYKEIYGQLFGKDIIYAREETNVKIQQTTRTTKQHTLSISETKDKTTSQIPEKLETIFNSSEFKALSNDAQKYFKAELIKNYQGKINAEFIKFVENLEYSKSKTKWKDVVKLFKKMANLTKTSSKQANLLFETKVGKEFYCDTSVFESLLPYLPEDKKLQKQFQTDLKWFQDEYKLGSNSKYYPKANRDNTSVIESFERYIRKRRISSKINIDNIIQKLKELYL